LNSTYIEKINTKEKIMTTAILPNGKQIIQERLHAGKFTWRWPLIIVFARLVLAFVAQALVAGVYMLAGDPTPWVSAQPWWVVAGTLIDLGCLVLLWRLVRQEGIGLLDLLNYQPGRFRRAFLQTVGLLVLYTILFLAGGMIFGPLIYGEATPPTPYGGLPLWAALYSVLVWPVLWAIAEQFTYLGYALPRLEVLSGKAWVAVGIVGFGWCIQHIALPYIPDWQWLLYRFTATLPIAIVLPIVYLRSRRLLPFIVAHWALDAFGTLAFVLLPLLQA
jgi:membrane protease YdiL (CAAX protease family)